MNWKDIWKNKSGTERIHIFFSLFPLYKLKQKIGTVLGVGYWVAREVCFDSREIDTHFCILKGPFCGAVEKNKPNN